MDTTVQVGSDFVAGSLLALGLTQGLLLLLAALQGLEGTEPLPFRPPLLATGD